MTADKSRKPDTPPVGRGAPPGRGDPRDAGAASPRAAQLLAELQDLRQQLAVERDDFEARETQMSESVRELEASRERYVDLFDFAPTGLVSLDRNGIIRAVNLAAVELLGVERIILAGSPLVHWVVEEDHRAFLRHLTHCRGSGAPDVVMTEVRFKAPARGVLFVRVLSRPCPGHFPTALVDLTDRQPAEKALHDSEEERDHLGRAMVGRELRMVELKQEVDELCRRLGEAPRYRQDAAKEEESGA
jgi:PAS domain S-box-containing protein